MSTTSRSGKRRTPIAIIGISGEFPRASSLEALHRNLCAGLDCVGPLSRERKLHSGIRDENPVETGHLDRVDLFDYEFFGLSRREAEQMDPQHRLLLQTSCLSIQNAGYSLRELRGTDTSVIFATPASNYYLTHLSGELGSAAVFGNTPSMSAGRVSYLLGLRGPAMVVDTTCSSSLLAVHEACNKLWLEEADVALAGGVHLKSSFAAVEVSWGREVIAGDGRCKTFDASADGTGVGECVGVVVLKPLPRALADGDHIHAVILGSATNNDGDRSNGMTSPSAEAQAEVLRRAWRNAGIEASDLGSIEVHGTGTRVGDPIETRGLTLAFSGLTDRKAFCALSSIKSNMGHSGYAAGVAALTKVVLSLKWKKLYPSIHVKTINPEIELEGSAVYINTQLRDWNADDGRPRRAAISAFGMAGTNVHVVLEEAPPRAPAATTDAAATSRGPFLVTVSGRTASVFERYVRMLVPAIEGSSADLADLAFVLCAGRDHYAHREAFVVNDKAELVAGLAQLAARGDATAAVPPLEVAFLLPGDVEIASEALAALEALHPAFAAASAECRSADGDTRLAETRTFVALYGRYRVWEALGLRPKNVFASGVGNYVLGAVRGKVALRDALEQAKAYRPRPGGFDRDGLRRALDRVRATMPVFVALGGPSQFVEEVRRHEGDPVVYEPEGGELSGALRTLAALYRQGVDVCWDDHFAKASRRRVELPAIPFERTRCWLDQAPAPRPVEPNPADVARGRQGSPAPMTGASIEEIEARLAAIWADILKADGFDRDADFGDVGGDSLAALDVAEQVVRVFAVQLTPKDFVDHPLLSSLAGRIAELRGDRSVPRREGE